MTDVHLQIPDEQAQRLSDEAARRNMTLPDFAADQLARMIPAEPEHRNGMVSEEFKRKIARSITEDEELLRRLA